MQFKDAIHAIGRLEVILKDNGGKEKLHFETDNLVVQTGREIIASRLSDESLAKPSHMAIGSNSTIEPNLSQTALGAELARVALAKTQRTDNTILYEAEFPPTVGTGEVVEAGIFNASSNGHMLNRTTFPIVTKEDVDTLTIRWNVTIN